MMALEKGHMECVKLLLDKGADVNKHTWVSGVIIHCVHAMQHLPRVPSSEWPCCLMTKSSTSLDEATCK